MLANPPYVAEFQRPGLAPEILRHEPEQALFAGGRPVGHRAADLAQLAGRARVRLIAIELGEGQGARACELAHAAGLGQVSLLRDLAGIERVLLAERGAP